MVMCAMEPVIIPQPPPLNLFLLKTEPSMSKTSHSSGFRLLDSTNDDTGSVCSVYKQKIDQMFESDSSGNVKNSVQARIEKMFTDVAIDGDVSANELGCHNFSVDYLGSVPLQGKVTSLAGLQMPLKELYFAYKRNSKAKKVLTGRLEISAAGLKVLCQGEKGDFEQLNTFPTIAVWSAVKFVLHESSKSPKSTDTLTTYAFLPLITDPDNIEKQQLFRPLEPIDQKYIATAESHHSPLFAVVMRKIGVHKQLECHGFVCQTSEDAIVIAATLYKSLMAHMKAKDAKKVRNRNGITSCMSFASSSGGCNDSGENSAPIRPPRKKRSTSSSVVSDLETIETESSPLIKHIPNKSIKKSTKAYRAPNVPNPNLKPKMKSKIEDLDAILPYEDPAETPVSLDEDIDLNKPGPSGVIKPPLGDKWNTYKTKNQKQITDEIKQVMNASSNMGLKRVKSLRRRAEEIQVPDNSGDILTKITIPRSGSFLNTGGLTRYKTKVNRSNGQATGGSPLGFSELFNEFRLQEGLHSLDEILGVIIDPEGMSFNDLKPIYKEFLLKLSVTLTKDELYQRSKSIMRRHRKKTLRRSTNYPTKRSSVVVFSKFKKLKHIFQRFRTPKVPRNFETHRCRDACKLPESSLSSTSYDTRHFSPRGSYRAFQKRQSYRRRCHNDSSRRDRHSTSDDSDFFSLKRSKATKLKHLAHVNHNRNSSSGYVSCSECSFDSDTCTCVSADRCYCSLGNNKNYPKVRNCKKTICKLDDKCYCSLDKPVNEICMCDCDTDSCADSAKCYCPKGVNHGTILEQLKRRGFMPSTETIVTPNVRRKLSKTKSNTRSSKSLEYTNNPKEYYERLKNAKNSGKAVFIFGSKKSTVSKINALNPEHLALDYDLFNSGGLGFYDFRQKSHNGIPSCCKEAIKNCAECSSPPDKATSEKKSAEIAALFADIRRSQAKDHARICAMSPTPFDSARSKLSGPMVLNSTRNASKQFPFTSRMITNALYSSSPLSNEMDINSNKMYSAKNGLYTIQSQSDDSRTSTKKNLKTKNNDDLQKHQKDFVRNKQASSGLENSLGYLP